MSAKDSSNDSTALSLKEYRDKLGSPSQFLTRQASGASSPIIQSAIMNVKRSIRQFAPGKSVQMASSDSVPLPVFVLGQRNSKNGNLVVTIQVMRFGTFKASPVEATGTDPSTGRAYLRLERDMRTKEKRAMQKNDESGGGSDGAGEPQSKIYDINDILGKQDAEERYDRAFTNIYEGDTMDLTCMDLTVSAQVGDIGIADIDILMWHQKETKTIEYMRKLVTIRDTIRMPPSMLVQYLFQNNWLTKHFVTRFASYKHFMEKGGAQASKQDIDRQKYDNAVTMFPTGIPVDRNPRIADRDSSLCWDETPTEKDAYHFTNMKKQVFRFISLTYSGMQWSGEPGDLSDWVERGGQSFVLRAPLYEEHFSSFRMHTVDAWCEFMACFHNRLRGIYIGSENLEKSANMLVNANSWSIMSASVADYGVASVDELTVEQKIEIVNKNRPQNSPHNFGMTLQPKEFIFDTVDFLRHVAIPVSAKTISAHWGGKTIVPAQQDLTQKQEMTMQNNLICLSECKPNSQASSVLHNPDYELRALIATKPTGGASKFEKYFEELENLDTGTGDQLFNFIVTGLFDDLAENLLEHDADYQDPQHIVRRYQFSVPPNKFIYFYAIDMRAYLDQFEMAEKSLEKIGRAHSNKREHAQIEAPPPPPDAQDAQDPPAKKPKLGARQETQGDLQQTAPAESPREQSIEDSAPASDDNQRERSASDDGQVSDESALSM